MKRVCIICRKSKDIDEFNIEHVIPESLGNKDFITDIVCEQCNKLLGQKVDVGLTNNFVAETYRLFEGVKGKSGSIPNPFREGKTEDGRIVHCNESLKPKYVPRVIEDELDNGILKIEASSTKEFLEIARKKFKRMGINKTDEEILKSIISSEEVSEQPLVKMSKSMDIYQIHIGFIKIAYEFANMQLGDKYLQDHCGLELANILEEYIYKDFKNNLTGKIARSHDLGFFELMKQIGIRLFNEESIHALHLFRKDNNLLVTIYLAYEMSFTVIVSDNYNLYNFDSRIVVVSPKTGKYFEM